MRKLRILFVTSWYPSQHEIYLGAFVREQAMALAREHDVRVIAPRLTRKPGRFLGDTSSLTSDEPLAVRPTATFVLPRRLSWSDAARAFSEATRKALADFESDGWVPDLIHGHTLLPAGWSALEIGRERDIPVVVTVHSSFVSQPVLTRSSESRVRATMTGVDALIAVGPTLVGELEELEPECQPLLLPNLVDDTFFSPAQSAAPRDSSQPVRIIGVGALIPAKRYDLLLRAVATQRESGVQIVLTIVGSGAERERLEQDAERLGISEVVTFAGAMDRRGVRDHLHDADVLVHPSRYETFGVVLIEAMACGVPVIATRSGGPEWVVEPETGQLVAVDDPIALGEAIRRFTTGEVSFDPGRVRARAIERFGAESIAGQVGAIYSELLNESN